MSWIEIGGFASGALCVWLTVRRTIWNFPVGLANNAFFFVLFLRAGLFGDAWLQVLYLALGVLGWYWWLHGGAGRTALVVHRTPRWAWAAAPLAVAALTWGLFELLTRHTTSTVPVWDALTTALSLVAQAMLNRKWIGTWALWIIADVIYVGLYLVKGLSLTAALYALFLAMCVVGWRQWRACLGCGTTDAEPVDVRGVGRVGDVVEVTR